MEKLKMVFRDFVWPRLPEEIAVSDTRQAQKLSLQKAGEAVQDLGPAGRTVTGEGLFLGARAVSDWEALWRCFSAGGTGTLLLPGAGPMEALFLKLALSGPPREGRIAYTFTFWEVPPPLRTAADRFRAGGRFAVAARKPLGRARGCAVKTESKPAVVQ